MEAPVLPSWMVVRSVPVESCRGTAGERTLRGEPSEPGDGAESSRRNGSPAIIDSKSGASAGEPNSRPDSSPPSAPRRPWFRS